MASRYPGLTPRTLFFFTAMSVVTSFIHIPLLLPCRLEAESTTPTRQAVTEDVLIREMLGMTSDYCVRTCRGDPGDVGEGN